MRGVFSMGDIPKKKIEDSEIEELLSNLTSTGILKITVYLSTIKKQIRGPGGRGLESKR